MLSLVLAASLFGGIIPLGMAAENQAPEQRITAFASLGHSTSTQYHTLGTPVEELDLPDSLACTVTSEESSREGRVSVSGWNAQPEYDPDTADSYVFAPDIDLSGGYTVDGNASLPAITVILEAAGQDGAPIAGQAMGIQSTEVVTGFDYMTEVFRDGDTHIHERKVVLGTTLDALNLPTEASVHLYDGANTSYPTLPITWSSKPAYNGEALGNYVFTPTVTGYAMKDGIELPTLTVIVQQVTLPPGQGDDYVITGIDHAEWFGSELSFEPGTERDSISWRLNDTYKFHQLYVTAANKTDERSGLTLTKWIWPDAFAGAEYDDKPLPDGEYILTAGFSDTFHCYDLSLDLPATPADGLVFPTIKVVISSTKASVDTADYQFDLDTGKLTVLTSAGTTAWRGNPWPSEVKSLVVDKNVTELGGSAFAGCYNMTSVEFEAGCAIPDIPPLAFSGADISSIDIPSSVRHIYDGAFSYCKSLAAVNFAPDSQLESIERAVFEYCEKLEKFIMPSGTKTLYHQSFFASGLRSITLSAALEDFGYDLNGEYSIISNGTFGVFNQLEEINVEAGSKYYTSENGVLYSADKTVLIGYPRAKAGNSFAIPDSVTKIGQDAFIFNLHLQEVSIHKDVTKIGVQAFAYSESLTRINVIEDSTLSEIGDGAFLMDTNRPIPLDIYLPRSLTSIGWYVFIDPDFTEDHANVKLFIYYGSPMMDWCIENNCPYYLRPSSAELQANPPARMYEHIPYQFVPATLVPDNRDLEFWTVPALPDGLTLVKNAADAAAHERIPGTIYGAPLDYTPFAEGVRFTMFAKNTGDVDSNHVAQAIFTIKLVPRPTTDEEFAEINTYQFEPYPGGDGKIPDITGSAVDVGNQIMHVNGPFPLFDSLWIDGIKQTPITQYTAADGSTTVTIMAQTIKELDNGTHIAAAAFVREDAEGSNRNNSDLDVVAQTFRIDLSDSTGSTNPPGNTDPTNSSDRTSNRDRDSGGSDADLPFSQTVTAPPPQTPTDPTAATDPVEGATVPPAPLPQPVAAPPAAPAASEEPGTDDEPPSETSPAPQGPGATVPDENTPVTGLPVGENGEFYFALDGSGAPFQVRIDIPFDEAEGVSFDGETFIPGVDCELTAGSTVVTVAAERLERYDAGTHTLLVAFKGGELPITFDLRKPAVMVEEPAPSTNAAPIVLVVVLVLGAAAVVIVIRKRRATPGIVE